MRGIVGVVIGMFIVLLVFSVLAGPVLEPVADVVQNDDAVQNSDNDYGSVVDDLEKVVLRWGPLIAMGGVLLAGARWVLRKEQLTGVRRR